MSFDENIAKITAAMTLLESVRNSISAQRINNWERQHSDYNIAKRISVIRDMLLDVQKDVEGRT